MRPLDDRHDSMLQLTFRCPLCDGAFQVAASDQGKAVACPHCGGAVAIPATATGVPPVSDAPEAAMEDPGRLASPVKIDAPTDTKIEREPPSARMAHTGPAGADASGLRIGDTEPGDPRFRLQEAKGLTREERAALRRQVNLLVFAVSAAILAIAVVCLLLWQG